MFVGHSTQFVDDMTDVIGDALMSRCAYVEASTNEAFRVLGLDPNLPLGGNQQALRDEQAKFMRRTIALVLANML
jgi:hypothetical protein